MTEELNPALAALLGSGDWSLARLIPPDALVITSNGQDWIVQARRTDPA